MSTTVVPTPLGRLEVSATDGRITGVRWLWDEGETSTDDDPVLATAAAQIEEYFAGERRQFDVPIDLVAASAFERNVLNLTAAIRYGETATYGAIATAVGSPDRARAVGGALMHNPIAVIIPCHRVVAADGALTGYGGGPDNGGRLDVKKALLDLERGVQRLFA